MDTEDDKVVDEDNNNNVDVATDDQPPDTDTSTNISSGLEQIEDDNSDMPLPMGMAEVISNRAKPPKQIGKVEQIDDDDVGPKPPTVEDSLNDADRSDKVRMTASLASTNNNDEPSPPVPFNSAIYEDNMMNKQRQKPAAIYNTNEDEVVMPLVEESVYIPISGRIESMDEIRGIANTEEGDINRIVEIESRGARDIESAGSINMADAQATVESTSTNQAGETDIHIPEAFLVEDIEEEVYIATPTLPWWKQRRVKIFFGVVIVLVGALVVALGVSLSQSNNPVETLFVTPPTFSIAPSLSIAPSTSPSITTYECFDAADGGRDGVLGFAVRSYVSQDCANNTKCVIAQTYVWPVNSWCVGSVKDMSYLFYDMDTFNEDINGWNTSSVTDMSFMFSGASSFNNNVSNLNTSSVFNMWSMFYGATLFNGDVSNFDTSSVWSMASVFEDATSFNGDLSSWNTSRVTSMWSMFKDATSFNQDLSNFDTSSVTDMESMFDRAKTFNQDLSNFDTSRVTDMSYMFYKANSFNGTVSNFNTSSVVDMWSMFEGAKSFNEDLCSWHDTFPYTSNTYKIFYNSGCTYRDAEIDAPKESQKGPFCASDCQQEEDVCINTISHVANLNEICNR